jgi:transposase
VGLTATFLEENNIPYIQKEKNPPCVPQLRPIEDFWATLKRRVYKNNFKLKTIENFIRKIKLELKKVDIALCERLMSNVPKKVHRAANYGVNS